MKFKKCSGCGRKLPLSQFAKNKSTPDGLQYKCRECFSKYNRERYLKKKEKIKADVRKYRQENPMNVYETRLSTCLKNPSGLRARKVVEAALIAGVLERPHVCSGCGCDDSEHRIEAHHHDYSKPLDVIWLCTPCHRCMDANRRVQEGKTPYGKRQS